MSLYMSYCRGCAEKVDKVRVISAVDTGHYGQCQGCLGHKSVQQYELGPTWEAVARMRRKNNGRKAGERRRDG